MAKEIKKDTKNKSFQKQDTGTIFFANPLHGAS